MEINIPKIAEELSVMYDQNPGAWRIHKKLEDVPTMRRLLSTQEALQYIADTINEGGGNADEYDINKILNETMIWHRIGWTDDPHDDGSNGYVAGENIDWDSIAEAREASIMRHRVPGKSS